MGPSFRIQHNLGEFGFKVSSNTNRSNTIMCANAGDESEPAVQGDTPIDQIDNFMD